MKLLFALLLTQQAPPIDGQLAAQYFAEAQQIAARDAGKLWGKPLTSPLIFADPRTRAVVTSERDAQAALQPQGKVFGGKLPDDVTIANHALEWSGTHWTMVRWPLPENRYTRQRLLAHEMFHRLQPSLGIPGSDVANGHLALGDGRILMRLEWRALAEALIRSGEARRTAIADALMFRARRRQLFERAANEERVLELNEGLAEYTGFKLSGLPEAVLPDRAAVQLANYETMDNFARSFAYASGPAYGLLLDAADPQWRRGIKPTSDLGELLRSAYRVTPRNVGELDARIITYTAERMVAEEKSRAERFAAQLKELRAKLVDGPTLALPVASKFNYSFDPNGAIPIEGVGTAYHSLRVTDEWGVLEVESGGALLVRGERGITGVRVPAPGDLQNLTVGVGWKLTLNSEWEVIADGAQRYVVRRK